MSINMIRTTISRIKRVWAVTFSPGLLRGDVRITPGKFQMLSSTQSPLPRRSKSSDSACKDRPWTSAASGEKEVFEDYLSSDTRANDTMHGAPPLYQTTSACRCDECNRIIAEIFGEETSLSQDKDLKRKLLTNIAQINLTDNFHTGKYATDKGQHGLFQRKKKGDDDTLRRDKLNKDDIDSEATTNTNDKSNPIDKLVIMKDKFNEEPKKEHVDAHQMYTNLYDVDLEEYQCKITDDNKSPNLGKKEHNVDAYWKDVYETAVGENSVYCEQHTLSIDEDTLNVYKVLKETDSKLDSTSKYRRLKLSPRELEKMIAGEKLFKDSSEREYNKKHVIRTNIEKEDDDKLIQKVENVDENPLVEAEKPKVDGSETAPRILGYVGKGKGLNSLDEVAKRCLTSPQHQIDEILLKEMEKLGIPLTLQRNNACIKVDDNKPDSLNKQKRVPQGEEIELDDRNIQSKSEKWAETPPETKEDRPLDTVNQFHLDLNRTKTNDTMKEKANFESETVCDANRENRNGWSYWHTQNSQQQQDPKRSGTPEQEHNTFAEQMWQKNQLDPKHVLTCNETCSISPKPLVHKNFDNVKGTEDMYEQRHRNLYMRDKPLLEEGESEPLATRTEDEPQHFSKPDYLNRSKTVDFTDIMKNNASTEDVEQQTSTTDSSNVTPPELPRREVDMEPREEPKNAEDLTEQTIIQVVDSDQLQLTTEQLQAASEQLHATCEHLQATTEQLQAATTQLQATSNHLCDSSDKLYTASENLNTTTEKLQHTSENLRESTEQLSYEQQMLINKLSNDPKKESYNLNEEAERTVKIYGQFIKQTPSNKEQLKMASTKTFINDTLKSAMYSPNKPTKDLSVNPAAAALISEALSGSIRDIKTEKPSSQEVETTGADEAKPEKTTEGDETDLKEFNNKCFSPNIEGWAEQATTINPSVPMTEDLPPIKPLPEINENIKLSELLKMVRERNRLVDCNEAVVLQKPKKPVPPLAKPMANPPTFNMPSIPYVKPNPKVCKPKKRDTKNCSRCNLETLGLGETTSFIGRNETRECLDVVNLDQQQTIDLTLAEDDFVTDLADDFILQLQSLGNTIESSYKRGKVEVLEAVVLEKAGHLTNMVRSQNYEPWSPISSWPYPTKPKQQKLQCPKDGCQIPPPLSVEDRPCGLKPCKTFPTFPRRTFSLLDCYPTTLSDHKIVDVGDF